MTLDTLKEDAVVRGDGVAAEELQRLKDGVGVINRDSGKYWTLRMNADNTRFQRWAGQSPDGKQRAEVMGVQPFPFDGASDGRVYWADMLVSEKVRMLMVSLWRASLTVLPQGRRRGDDAWRSEQTLRWFLRKLGWGQHREWIRAANFAFNDSPGIALMMPEWRRTREVELKRLTVGELAELYVRLSAEAGGGTEEDLLEWSRRFEASLLDPEATEDVLAGTIGEYFEVSEARARKAAREIRETGSAEFPVPGPWMERVELRALRFMDDFYVLDGTRDFERCQLWYSVRWMDRVEVEERVASEGWSREWADELLKHEGESCFDEYAMSAAGTMEQVGKELRTGLYQVVEAHYRALTEDGVTGRFSCVFSSLVAEGTAYGRRVESRSGAVVVTAETVDQWLLNSRGIPHRIGPAAGLRKGIMDDLNDSARMQLLPPVTAEGYGTGKNENIPLEPLGMIPLKRGGKVQYLGGMSYPAHVVESLRDQVTERDELFARPVDGKVPRVVSDVAQEFEVSCWLGFAQDVYGMVMDLIRDNASDEELARIADDGGAQVMPEGRRGLSEGYAVSLRFDPMGLDEERMIKRVNALTQVKQSDGEQVLDMTPVVKAAVRALLPHYADEALRLENAGGASELERERRNYMSIRAGVMPEMVTDGTWNYDVRLGFYERMVADNPAVFADMGEDKVALLERWLGALEFQAEQFGANREIGRTGVAAV